MESAGRKKQTVTPFFFYSPVLPREQAFVCVVFYRVHDASNRIGFESITGDVIGDCHRLLASDSKLPFVPSAACEVRPTKFACLRLVHAPIRDYFAELQQPGDGNRRISAGSIPTSSAANRSSSTTDTPTCESQKSGGRAVATDLVSSFERTMEEESYPRL